MRKALARMARIMYPVPTFEKLGVGRPLISEFMTPTPTAHDGLELRRVDFETLPEALDYAARGKTGLNFYSARGELATVLPYAELRERATDIARGLIQAGLPRGARVVLLADTDPDFVIYFLACQYASILPVPVALPVTIGGREAYIAGLRRQLEGAGAAAAMANDELISYLRSAAEGLDIGLIGTPSDFNGLPGSKAEVRPFGKDDPCYLQYSSGSTRWPQGIDIPQRSLLANSHAIAHFGLDINAGDRCISWLPFYHDMGLVGFMLTPLLTQMSVDYLATRDFARRPLQWLSLITRNSGSLSFSPSFGYDLCTRRASGGNTGELNLESWRVAGIGGDMVQPHVLQRFGETFAPLGFHKTAFVPSYGLAETTLAITFSALGREVHIDAVDRQNLADERTAVAATNGSMDGVREFVVCGKPMPGHEVQVRDTDGRILPDRRVGLVFAKGPSVMAGYFGNPEATARILDEDGWLNTGDLGYTIDGALVIAGRDKDLIIINGRNIWPQDLEWAAEELPQLRSGDAAAFTVDDAGETEQVVVLVQCRVNDPDARADLTREITGVIRESAGIECEVALIPPRSLPKTSSGKLNRSRAREMYLNGIHKTDAGPGRTEQETARVAAPAGVTTLGK